jgi:hypothetical protein
MYQYPGQTYDFITSLGKPNEPEDIKTYFGKDHGAAYGQPIPPDFINNNYKTGCCSKNI